MEPCDGISINLRSYIVRTNRMPHQPTLYTHHVKQKSICPVKSHWNLWTVCYHYITWSLLTDTQPKPNHYLSFSWKIRVILNISFPLPLVNWFPSIFLKLCKAKIKKHSVLSSQQFCKSKTLLNNLFLKNKQINSIKVYFMESNLSFQPGRFL